MFRSLSRAAARYASSKLRSARVLPTAGDWEARAGVCARCPLYTVQNKVAYCGRPYLEGALDRGAELGCGCPIGAKARSPGEHCPVTVRYEAASQEGGRCDCKWCAAREKNAVGSPAEIIL